MKYNSILIAVAFIITIAATVLGGYVQEGVDIEIGSVSLQKIKADRKVENKIATERNKLAAQAAADKLDSVTERDETVNEKIIESIDGFFEAANELRKLQTPIFNPYEQNAEDGETVTETRALGISLTNSLTELLITMDTHTFNNFTNQMYDVINTILEKGIQEIDAKSLLYVRDEINKLDLTADMKTLCYEVISAFLKPNIIVNEAATLEAWEKRASEYEIMYFLKDQTIVDEGQIVTEEEYYALEALGKVRGNYKDSFIRIIGVIALILTVFFLAIFYMYNFYKTIASNKKEALLIFSLYMTVIFFCFLLGNISYFFLPIIVVTLLVSVLIDLRLAIVLNFCITLISMFICKGDIEFTLYFFLSGTCTALISKYTTERNKIILVGIFSSILNFVIIFGVMLFFEKKYSVEVLYSGLFAAASGIISVILAIGSLPIWEAAFGIVTTIKLLDLANPNSTLLRRLTIEAPGTYHHSLIVANLAETAAYEIGANPNLARVGAYYHDIGKLKYPAYFSENQVGENPHDGLDPYSSVQVIVSHVTYGLELADAYKLPKAVKDIITQHHGTTLVKYFYHKAKSKNPDAQVEEKDFRYTFEPPQSKEAAIVMMADTVEAAVRSMMPSGKTMEEVEVFARTLVKDKLDDGQLTDSTLTLRDIDTIIKSFMRVFKGMYHERIPYPKK